VYSVCRVSIKAMQSHILVTVLTVLTCHLSVESTDSGDSDGATESCFCQVCVITNYVFSSVS